MIVSFVLAAALSSSVVLIWLLIGLLAGFLAGKMMNESGFGIGGDIVVGLIGAFVGGMLTDLLIPDATTSFIGSLFVAFIGACVFIAALRFFTGRKRTY
ncbi:GlsB/YeaQ/YmgE family stress response membrane protein [Tengunoibacter tsumagoiensis]|uniref:Transglycosylase n=1 Tax=Tengunoibacter tsumagoiensis TaxID=2014871 RepID=A0A401ZVL8_9CHLR|nr:GlsB/YeaQ/YmgE family stress response membrane protein [Tengunoibacter tsumagoiensis]GCE10941.1 transglycosylase [Tengunoibacter tsumagoiensis]